MPKGSKKRKAAKKKEKISSASTPSHDDVKNQEGKDSDVGEASSPVSQDYLSQKNVSGGGGEESVVRIERGFDIEGESNEKDEGRKSYDGGSSSSSSGSSSSSSDGDEEEEERKVVEISPPVVVDNSPVVEPVKETDLLSETAAEPVSVAVIEEANVSVVETPVVDEITSLVEKAEVDPVSNGSFEKKEDSNEGKVGISAEFVDVVSETKGEEFVIQSVENVATVSEPKKECAIQENEDRLVPSYDAGCVPTNNGGESEKDSVTQPLLEQPVEKSSWKSCCGLCELFGK